MDFIFAHTNFNVLDLQKSLAFYRQALGLTEQRRIETKDFTIVYVGNDQSDFQLELTWLKNRKEPYNLGENEFHTAFRVGDMEAAHKNTKKWAVSSMKTRIWEFISLPIRMAIGLKSFR